MIRSKHLKAVGISFVDASGVGKGSSTIALNHNVSIHMGKTYKEESSNFLELENLMDTLDTEYAAGHLTNVELFLCTDNIVSERAFYKGNSKSRKLFDLIVRLRKFQLYSHCKVHVLHVAGTRMIEQGTDGLSRGSVFEGTLGSKQDFLKVLPLDKTVFDRAPLPKEWLFKWLPDTAEILKPEDWFEKGQDVHGWKKSIENKWAPVIKHGIYIWCPPPAAAYKAMEQLRTARHKRLKSIHVFLCPRLFTSQWRSQLHKSADVIFEMPPSVDYWSKEMHEPIVVGLYFPSFEHKPWFIKGTPWSIKVQNHLRQSFKSGSEVIEYLKSVLAQVVVIQSSSAIEVESSLLLENL